MSVLTEEPGTSEKVAAANANLNLDYGVAGAKEWDKELPIINNPVIEIPFKMKTVSQLQQDNTKEKM